MPTPGFLFAQGFAFQVSLGVSLAQWGFSSLVPPQFSALPRGPESVSWASLPRLEGTPDSPERYADEVGGRYADEAGGARPTGGVDRMGGQNADEGAGLSCAPGAAGRAAAGNWKAPGPFFDWSGPAGRGRLVRGSRLEPPRGGQGPRPASRPPPSRLSMGNHPGRPEEPEPGQCGRRGSRRAPSPAAPFPHRARRRSPRPRRRASGAMKLPGRSLASERAGGLGTYLRCPATRKCHSRKQDLEPGPARARREGAWFVAAPAGRAGGCRSLRGWTPPTPCLRPGEVSRPRVGGSGRLSSVSTESRAWRRLGLIVRFAAHRSRVARFLEPAAGGRGAPAAAPRGPTRATEAGFPRSPCLSRRLTSASPPAETERARGVSWALVFALASSTDLDAENHGVALKSKAEHLCAVT